MKMVRIALQGGENGMWTINVEQILGRAWTAAGARHLFLEIEVVSGAWRRAVLSFLPRA